MLESTIALDDNAVAVEEESDADCASAQIGRMAAMHSKQAILSA